MTAGMIATSDPRASRIGGQILSDGGNALDAAVTAALTLFVLEPHACGLGGDAFVLLKTPGEPPTAIDGSGAIPAHLAAAATEEDFDAVPRTGPRTFTVPGAVGLFETALAQYGTIGLADATSPARDLARTGFAVRQTLAMSALRMSSQLSDDAVLAPLYLPSGRPVREGDLIRNPRLADALDVIAVHGARELYEGALARAISDRSQAGGGYLDADDLAAHRTVPMTPISTSFQGSEVWELPPPTQGVAVLEALAELEAGGRFDPDALIEAITEGMLVTGVDLRSGHRSRRGFGDTTYVAAVDDGGLGVSLITSIFSEFGSTVGVDTIGGPLQNRATGTSIVGQRPRPGKPPHTTIPALVTQGGELSHVLGVVGGYMQAQGQVQLLVNLLVHGMGPQEAIDAPRLRILNGGEIALEPGHELATRIPEAVGREPGNGGFGGGQAIFHSGDVLRGGSDPRRGGLVVHVLD
jgi:gamma-glutamyltranspeptidase / glutathione hydrolase